MPRLCERCRKEVAPDTWELVEIGRAGKRDAYSRLFVFCAGCAKAVVEGVEELITPQVAGLRITAERRAKPGRKQKWFDKKAQNKYYNDRKAARKKALLDSGKEGN